MFGTLLGALPRPAAGSDGDSIEARIAVAIRAQEAAGLEPITDGRLRDPDFGSIRASLLGHSRGEGPVEGWQFAAGLTDRAVKQALPGPYTVGRLVREDEGGAADGSADPGRRRRATLEAAEALAELARGLAEAGCVLIEIEESEAHVIGEDEAERDLYRAAHRRLTDGAGSRTHLSLSIVGGSAADAGVDTILDAPYASLAVDLIAGPDNWNLVTRTPGDRGVIGGVLSAGDVDESREVMLWAAHYAASSGGRRGIDRVGLGSAGSYANLTWEAAVRKMEHLGSVARLASMPPGEELARSLDPRAVSSRRAAVGHGARPQPRRRRPG
jgi:hypothetical protein